MKKIGRNKGFKVLLVILGLIVIGKSIFLLLYNNNNNRDNEGNNPDNLVVVDMCDPSNEDYGKIYYSPLDCTHIVEDGNVRYIDNEILIVAQNGITREQITKLADGYDVKIIGEIEITGDYQLKTNNAVSAEVIKDIVERLNKEDIVKSATLNYVGAISETKQTEERDGFFYGKKWQKDLQNFNNAKGKSWGLEAIGTIEAWDKLTHTSNKINPVKVGIVDSGFEVYHEDLDFAEVFYDNGSNGLFSRKIAHGTHVAGTMAAKNNDNTGICGIYPYGAGRLYGVSNCESQGTEKYNDSLMSEKIAFAELIVRNVKVINTSRGFSWYKEKDFKKWYDKTSSDSHFDGFNACADFLGDFFQRMLDVGYDFVIVSAAGNNSSRLPSKFDSRYTFWINGIPQDKYPEVYNRIIVVGAVDQKLNVTDFSDGGDRVDIYAPGQDIYSTWPNNKYKKDMGTSMAAPHVSGVAAMVWSANSSLTGSDVKESITKYCSIRCISCHMVDANMAVGHALWNCQEMCSQRIPKICNRQVSGGMVSQPG